MYDEDFANVDLEYDEDREPVVGTCDNQFDLDDESAGEYKLMFKVCTTSSYNPVQLNQKTMMLPEAQEKPYLVSRVFTERL